MSIQYPVLPVAGGTLVRAFAALLSLVMHWVRQLARAHRHRRDATKLAGLDRRMLADIGLTRADVHDAFSEPFWEDPTALLRERALERRLNHGTICPPRDNRPDVHLRLPTNRPARRTT